MILDEQLQGLPGHLRQHMEERIQTCILNMLKIARKPNSRELLDLTLQTEVANIKAVIDLAQFLHQPQDLGIPEEPTQE